MTKHFDVFVVLSANAVGKALATSIQIGEILRQLTRNMCARGLCKCRLRYSVVSVESLCLSVCLCYVGVFGAIYKYLLFTTHS